MMSVAEVSETLCKAGEEQFTETGPRPTTLPGQEQDATFTDDIDAKLKSALKLPAGYHNSHMSERAAVLSPTLSPCKSQLHGARRSHHSMQGLREKGYKNDLEAEPPLGYEPEGSEGTTPPSCLKWAQNLRNLLRDGEGVELFKRYLKQEGCEDSLNFWFACEGLKKQPPDNLEHIQQLIKVIYRKYIRSHSTIQIGASTRKVITDKLAGKSPTDRCIFDGAQREVEHAISMSTYLNFLKSEIYLQHVRSMQNGPNCELSPKHGDGSTSASASASCSLPSSGSSSSSGRLDMGGPLQTVMEDCELTMCTAPTTLPLTSKLLMATQRHRASYSEARKPEAYAGVYLQQAPHSRNANPYHAMYGTLIPGSAQDSELQSLSSDAHTDDTISLTDSSVDGAPTKVSRKYLKQQHRAMRQNANQNKDPLNHIVIPRTQRLPVENITPKEPEAFAATLIEKLEAVKRSQESQERIDESLRKLEHEETKCYNVKADDRIHNPLTTVLSAMKTLALGDENDQSILDEHCSRVWNDSAHQTPSRSPGRLSPPLRPHSPERRRASAPPLANPYSTKSPYINAHLHHRHRKERDVASMFSNDSGAVPDFADSEGSLSTGAFAGGSGSMGGPPFHHKHGHHHSTKLKVAGDGFDTSRGNLGDPYGAAASDLQRRTRDVGKRSSGKKSFLDSSSSGIDSGVSLAYEPSSQQPSNFNSREKVMSWVLENEKYSSSHPSDSEKDSSSRHKKSSYSTLSATSPGPNRSGRGKKPVTYNASRSGSLERGGHIPRSNPLPQPTQPFMSDPSMPILPPPNTTTQLEEARRRLEDDTKSKLAKSKSGASGKDRMLYLDLEKGNRVNQSKMSLSGISLDAVDEGATNLKKSSKKLSSSNPPLTATTPGSSVEGEFTIVGYHFAGESVPYRSKLAGKNIVLKQFKSLITKKGNFRYFFKSESDEFGTGIVYEEVNEDNEVLPLWEGKIFARLESID